MGTHNICYGKKKNKKNYQYILIEIKYFILSLVCLQAPWAQLFKANDLLKFTSNDTQISWNFSLKKCE